VSELGVWDPIRPEQAAEVFEGYNGPWWVAGGWAIDAFLARQTRVHGDLDVGVLRRNQLVVQEHLADWDLQAADPPGSLRPWQDEEALPESVHNIWVRRSPGAPWGLQLMLEEAENDEWLFRRMPSVRRDLDSLVWYSEGVPYLVPEVQLLYKAGHRSPKNEADFDECLPSLDVDQRRWLSRALAIAHPGHPWIRRLDAA
jgi:hypothetical protein